MSQENVEIVEEVWRAINRGDVDGALSLVTDDADLRPPSQRVDGIVFRGHAGLRAWMERAAEMWREIEVSPRELATVGEHVVTALDVRLVGHQSGVALNEPAFVVHTLRDGKIAAAITYPNEREALEAVGLRE